MELKTINDYVDALHEKYPLISKKDIKRILSTGFKYLYLFNSYGCDVLILKPGFWCYFGTLTKNSLLHSIYYSRKLATKIRVLFRRRKEIWDGYYYFSLNTVEYTKYLELKKKRGRPRKNFNYGNKILFKLLDECKASQYYNKYIFRVPLGIDMGFKIYRENFKSDKAELIITKDSTKFKDNLISSNIYDTV